MKTQILFVMVMFLSITITPVKSKVYLSKNDKIYETGTEYFQAKTEYDFYILRQECDFNTKTTQEAIDCQKDGLKKLSGKIFNQDVFLNKADDNIEKITKASTSYFKRLSKHFNEPEDEYYKNVSEIYFQMYRIGGFIKNKGENQY